MSTSDDQPGQDRPPAGRRRAKIEIEVSGDPPDIHADIRKAVRRALQSQGVCEGMLEVAIVGDAEMRRQHQDWMGLDSTTDVLSFDLRENGPDAANDQTVDGQLIVCKSVARRRARTRGLDWRAELMLYVVHGCLHLCGHDDHDPEQYEIMHREEDRILTALGWGQVFSRRQSGSTRAKKPRAGKSSRSYVSAKRCGGCR